MKIKRSLVHQLRAPIRRVDDKGTPNSADIAEKMNAIGDALAYLIERKKMKRSVKTTRRG